MKPGILYLIPTVLAEDTAQSVIPAQVTNHVSSLDYFLVENARTSRRFVKSICPEKVIEHLQFVVVDKDTPPGEVKKALQPILEGKDGGVISEAGCPGIADPGAELAKYAHQAGIKVVPLVGPSAILLSLMGSGFNGQSFAFHGYIPIEKKQRFQAIKNLEKEMLQRDQTQIFMETPYRNNQMLTDLMAALSPGIRLCIAANLTAPDEFLQTKTVAEWKQKLPDLHKIPAVFLIYKGF